MPTDKMRYERQTCLLSIGEEGQERLHRSRVLVVGAGGLGSPALLYLAGAGVGTLGIVDDDLVHVSNLHRQVIHSTQTLGRPKVHSAEEALYRLNPEVAFQVFQERLTPLNVDRLFDPGWDVVLDCCDNAKTRYLLNDACVARDIPLIHGSVSSLSGQITTFLPPKGPCYRCLYPLEPKHDGPKGGGVLGTVPGTIGTLQATEAIKILLGIGSSLVGRLLVFDALGMNFQSLGLTSDPSCRACGQNSV